MDFPCLWRWPGRWDANDFEWSAQVKKIILIHQPHPDQKMGAVRLQQIGKRLWRRFGLERQRFEGL